METDINKLKETLRSLRKQALEYQNKIKEAENEAFLKEVQKIADTGYKIELVKKFDSWDGVYYLSITTVPDSQEIKQELNEIFHKFHNSIEENEVFTFNSKMKTIPQIITEYTGVLGEKLFGYETKQVDHCDGSENDPRWEVYRFYKNGEESFWRIVHEDNYFKFEFSQVEPTEITVKGWKNGDYIYYA